MKKRFLTKLLSLVLCAVLLLGAAVPAFAETPAPAASAFAEGENALIVFVTGIGQSWTYLFDDRYATPELQKYETYAPLIANGEYKARWNLFNNYFDEVIKEKSTVKTISRLAGQLFGTLFTRRNQVKEQDVRDLVDALFGVNIPAPRGEVKANIVTPRYTMPVSAYPKNAAGESEAKDRFYGSIPCAEIARRELGENFEDYLYCYNYNAFSYSSENVKGLKAFIDEILETNTVGAKDVVLVPMSMGASVVSLYLNDYPDPAENHVRRVVSVVGCWEGSDVVYDLLTKSYADNSPDLLYNGLLAEMIGEPWGYVVNWALRLFAKQALRDFIDEALGVFAQEIFLRAPSLCALVPTDKYPEVRALITDPVVREEADHYYEAQSTVRERLKTLEGQGVDFSFIAGYGLAYGAVTDDYKAFGFMHSAAKTNSDEIIQISSTAPGTQFVAWNETFADKAGRELSPDGSIDISGTVFKDSTWFFRGQKHELEYNTTAMDLAIQLALGKVKKTADCADPNGENYFPQFNGAKNVKALKNDYLPAFDAYVAGGGSVTPEQKRVRDEAAAVLTSHVCDKEKDDQKIEALYAVLVDLGLKEAPGRESGFKRFFGNMLKKGNDVTYKLFGAKGFLDFTK